MRTSSQLMFRNRSESGNVIQQMKQSVKSKSFLIKDLRTKSDADTQFATLNAKISKELKHKTTDKFISNKKMDPATWIEDTREKKETPIVNSSVHYKTMQENFVKKLDKIAKNQI